MHDCLSRAQAIGLLNDDLEDTQRELIELHLEACSRCRSLLEEVASDDQWPRWAQLLREKGSDGDAKPHVGDDPQESMSARLADLYGAAAATNGAGQPLPKIPGYELEAELGRGGMGVVYQARQLSLNRAVALKMVVGGSLAGPERLARFRDEAETIARLQHPRIVQIYDIGQHQGMLYLSLELVPGPSLQDLLSGEPQAPRGVAMLMSRVAHTLAAVHAESIVHRDLKPANILLKATARQGMTRPASTAATSNPLSSLEPKIADFGLAKHLEGDGITKSGDWLGTPAYMAPEQVDASFGELSPATDVYALGSILYELLAGRPPLEATTPSETLRQLMTDTPISPRRLNPLIDKDLETITLKCLEKKASRRYRSAAELYADLTRWLEHKPIQARPVGRLGSLLRWCQRHPAVATLTSLLLILLVATAVGAVVQLRRETQLRRDAEEIAVREAEASALAQQALRDVEDVVYFDRIRSAHDCWLDNRVAEMNEILASCPVRLRHWEWRYLQGLTHTELASWQAHPVEITASAMSGDGRRFVTAAADGELRMWQIAGVAHTTDGNTAPQIRRLYALPDSQDGFDDIAWSPDGNLIATAGHDHSVVLRDALTGNALRRLPGHQRPVRSLQFIDNAHVISGSDDGTVRLWGVASGEEIRSFTHTGAVTSVAVDPAGNQIAAFGQREITLWNLAEGSRVRRTRVMAGPPHHRVAFAPDGSWLAASGRIWVTLHPSGEEGAPTVFSAGVGAVTEMIFLSHERMLVTTADRSVTIREIPSGRVLRTLRGHSAPLTGAAANDDAGVCVTTDETGVAKLWPLDAALEYDEWQAQDSPLLDVAASPDGTWIAASDQQGSIHLWDLATGKKVTSLSGHEGTVVSIAFDSTSRWLASAGEDRTVRLWDVEKGLQETVWSGHSRAVASIAFSPDSQMVASGSRDATVRLWKRGETEPLHVLIEPPSINTVGGVAFTQDGRHIVAATGRIIRAWDVATGALLSTTPAHDEPVLRWSQASDGRLASFAGDSTGGKIWRVDVGHAMPVSPVVTYRTESGIFTNVAFSSDGKRLVATGASGSLHLFSADTGRKIMTLNQPGGTLTAVTFTPDDSRLIAARSDGVLVVW